MDETKIALPAWLPWATTACLAALVACLGELWIIEKTRSQMLKDENLMAAAMLKSVQNQGEAERIIAKREIEGLRDGSAANAVSLLAAPAARREDPVTPGQPWGAAVWDGSAQDIHVLFSGLPVLGSGKEYQLWVVGQGLSPGNQSILLKDPARGIAVHWASPGGPSYRILLVAGEMGGAATLEEAKSRGSIVLATLPPAAKISNR